MGFEGPRKPPQFIIDAAMKEDPTELRRIQAAGRKAAAQNRQARKDRLEDIKEAKAGVQAQLAEERAWREHLLSPEAARRDDLLPED